MYMSVQEQKEKLPWEGGGGGDGLPKDTGSASIKSALDRRQRVVGRLFNWRHGSVEGQYFALYLVKNWNRIPL